MSPVVHGAITLHGLPFQGSSISFIVECRGPMTPLSPKRQRFGLFPVRSPLLGESLLFSSPAGNEMFQFPRSLALTHDRHQTAGLPHSEIHGSRVTCTSPWPIAAYHVLHRLREPRHPPRALNCSRSLASCFYNFYLVRRVPNSGSMCYSTTFFFVDQMIH